MDHSPLGFTRSFSESSKDRLRRNNLNNDSRRGSSSPSTRSKQELTSSRFTHCHSCSNVNNGYSTPVKRTVRIVDDGLKEYRPVSLELEHVTIGEVTPTVYVKDKNNIIDESLQKSESVLKRSLSVSNSRLQRKISRRLAPKDRTISSSDENPSFLRRNRSSSSIDKTSPPPDLLLFAKAGLQLEDIAAFGNLYVRKLEYRMRNIDLQKEVEKQHNISCRERLKLALDNHDQLAAGLEQVKNQLKECMETYRFISETFV